MYILLHRTSLTHMHLATLYVTHMHFATLYIPHPRASFYIAHHLLRGPAPVLRVRGTRVVERCKRLKLCKVSEILFPVLGVEPAPDTDSAFRCF
jgi:hypothetical protein